MRIERQRDEEREFEVEGWKARYIQASALLGVNPDIAPIFLDAHLRSELGVEPGDPLKVRRDFPDLFKNQLLEVGIVYAMSAIAIANLFPGGWQASDNYWCYVLLALGVSLVISSLIVLLRLRARIK